ncbi:MAG: DUF6448 family protein [Dehalococcoidia bacterium]
MPPHCDSMDGPVVKAAMEALERRDVNLVLPYVQPEGEAEVSDAFNHVVRVRGLSAEAQEVADRYFFETVVRVHRAGEGAPYTGLKPAGLDHGPVVPVAERSLSGDSPDELIALLTHAVEHEVRIRWGEAVDLGRTAAKSLPDARAYVEAMLGLQVWAHALYLAAKAPAHAGALEAGHGSVSRHVD